MTARVLGPVERLWRYYQAGVINTLFGYGLFAILVALGLGRYPAQLLAHLLGMLFNYVSYSRHAFSDFEGSKWRFALSYAFNYAMSLGALAAVSLVVTSPYLAGLVAIIIVSVLNFFVLKHFVFVRKTQQ